MMKFQLKAAVNNLETVVAELNKIATEVVERRLWENSTLLSEVLVELASYTIFLADFVGEAHLAEGQAKDTLTAETAKAQHILIATGMAVNRAEIEAKADPNLQKFQVEYRRKEHDYMSLNLKRMSIGTLIDAIRTRVSTLNRERDLS